MQNWDSNIFKFCSKIQQYRSTFGKLLEEFLSKKYIIQTGNGKVCIESTSKLKIVSVKIDPDLISNKSELEELTKSCIEKTFDEYIRCLKNMKSEFNSVKSKLNKNSLPIILDSSKKLLEN